MWTTLNMSKHWSTLNTREEEISKLFSNLLQVILQFQKSLLFNFEKQVWNIKIFFFKCLIVFLNTTPVFYPVRKSNNKLKWFLINLISYRHDESTAYLSTKRFEQKWTKKLAVHQRSLLVNIELQKNNLPNTNLTFFHDTTYVSFIQFWHLNLNE